MKVWGRLKVTDWYVEKQLESPLLSGRVWWKWNRWWRLIRKLCFTLTWVHYVLTYCVIFKAQLFYCCTSSRLKELRDNQSLELNSKVDDVFTVFLYFFSISLIGLFLLGVCCCYFSHFLDIPITHCFFYFFSFFLIGFFLVGVCRCYFSHFLDISATLFF